VVLVSGGSGTANQGYDGGDNSVNANAGGCGGGGAGATGTDLSSTMLVEQLVEMELLQQ
jgi:hypothetical protein